MLSKKTTEEIIGAVGGLIVGAIVGSISSLLAAVIGGILGGLIGFGIARAIDAEENRVSLHDHELDRAIGIEGGTMGTGLAKPPTPSTPPPPVGENEWFREA
jgi:hypothetical protein